MFANQRNRLAIAAMGVGLLAMSIATVSEAGPRHHHRWYQAGKKVKVRGCKKTIVRRYCRINRNGVKRCYKTRKVRWVC